VLSHTIAEGDVTAGDNPDKLVLRDETDVAIPVEITTL
jgi:hypothetical protein